MPLDNLRAFVDAISAAGELARVERPVSVDKEVTEIADRCMKSPGGGPALLFRHPTLLHGGPSRYPVAVNLFGSARRMALALGVECLDDIGKRIATLLNLKIPDTLLGKLAMLPQLAEVAKFPPRTAGGRAPSQEVVRRDRDVDLAELPIPVCWPEDGGPYITLAGVITRDPGSGVRNVGMYRVQVLGPNELAMHWQRHKVGGAGRADAGRDRAGRRSRLDLRGVGAAPAHDRRVPVRGFPEEGAGAPRQGRHVGPRGAGRSGDRDRRLRRSARGAGARRPVWGPHRLLFAGGLLPEGARHCGDDACRPDLAAHDRGAAADGDRKSTRLNFSHR